MEFSLEMGIPVLERTPASLRTMLLGLPEAWVMNNEGGDSWSPYDVVGHLVSLDRADWLRARTRAHDALLIINDRPDIAVLVDADGVHVGQDDLPVAAARRIVGASRLVGISTHDVEQVEVALPDGPDYIAVGPMFASATKPQDRTPGPEFLGDAVRIVAGQMPIVAIGGVRDDRCGFIKSAGGLCVAVTAAVVAAEDPGAAVDALRGGLS